MYVETYYDEKRDRGVTVPGLAADMAEVMETGIVNDIGLELEFNGLDEPGNISGRVNDIFEALEAARARAIDGAKQNVSLRNQPGSPTEGVTSPIGEGDES